MDQLPTFPDEVLEPWVGSSSCDEDEDEEEAEEEQEEEEQEKVVKQQLHRYKTRTKGRR